MLIPLKLVSHSQATGTLLQAENHISRQKMETSRHCTMDQNSVLILPQPEGKSQRSKYVKSFWRALTATALLAHRVNGQVSRRKRHLSASCRKRGCWQWLHARSQHKELWSLGNSPFSCLLDSNQWTLQHSKFFYKHTEYKTQPTLCLNCYCNWDGDVCGRNGSYIHHVVTSRVQI